MISVPALARLKRATAPLRIPRRGERIEKRGLPRPAGFDGTLCEASPVADGLLEASRCPELGAETLRSQCREHADASTASATVPTCDPHDPRVTAGVSVANGDCDCDCDCLDHAAGLRRAC